jgi:hypothetical protein
LLTEPKVLVEATDSVREVTALTLFSNEEWFPLIVVSRHVIVLARYSKLVLLFNKGILLDLDSLFNITGNGLSQSEGFVVGLTNSTLTSLRDRLHEVQRS